MKLVFLEYSFMFDPAKTWMRLSDFEKDLAKFFDGLGLEAHVISPAEGRSGRNVLYIKSKAAMDQSVGEPKKPGRPLSVKGSIEKLKVGKESAKAKKFKKGKLLKRKGYLRR